MVYMAYLYLSMIYMGLIELVCSHMNVYIHQIALADGLALHDFVMMMSVENLLVKSPEISSEHVKMEPSKRAFIFVKSPFSKIFVVQFWG